MNHPSALTVASKVVMTVLAKLSSRFLALFSARRASHARPILDHLLLIKAEANHVITLVICPRGCGRGRSEAHDRASPVHSARLSGERIGANRYLNIHRARHMYIAIVIPIVSRLL